MTEVSVITALYNSADFIAAAIASVQAQTLQDWEMIIVDDCSTDDSCAIVQRLADADSRIKLIRLPQNGGAAVARNTAIRAAQGRYIAFLDSDDSWFPNKLDRQIEFMKANQYPFVFSAYERVDEAGAKLSPVHVPARVSYRQLLKTNVIGCFVAIYDSRYFGKVEMPLIRKRQDFGLWLCLLKKVDYAYAIQEPLGTYRVRNESVSSNKLDASSYNWQLYRHIEKLPLLASLYYFAHYAVRGVLRRHCPRLARLLGA
ncbi:MAG TPA: glycosyltransferase family 2 protein [Eoetvoesiella sp.]